MVIQRIIMLIENVSMLSAIGLFFLGLAARCVGYDTRMIWAGFFLSLGALVLTIIRPTIQQATAALMRRQKIGGDST